MNEEIRKLIKEKGLLIEKEVFDLMQSFPDAKSAKDFLEGLERFLGQKIITKSTLNKNIEYVQNIVSKLGDNKEEMQRVFVKFGISLEVRKEQSIQNLEEGELAVTMTNEVASGANGRVEESKEKAGGKEEAKSLGYKIFYADTKTDKKLAVEDFTGNFRARYQFLQRILMQRADLQNLASIGKISNDRQSLSIIGIVKDKRITKNKNVIITFEDLTGEISVLVRSEKEELFRKANELILDEVVAVRASGSRDMLFANEIYFPDAFVQEKMRFDQEINVAFLSDVHCGGKKHLGKSFERFLEWLNSEDENARKIKFIFFVGDNVDGVGIFPGQEKLLELGSMKEQYALLAYYLKKVPKYITMFMCPGQHDAVRVAEPQPLIDRKYASALYEIENLVLVTNPTLVKLIEKDKEFKILMYHGASIHEIINEIPELRESKAHKTPAKAVKHLLKRRHLAPTHSAFVYIPNLGKDPLVINEVPDVLCTGEVHRLDIENYNGVLIITGSCWQGQTDFEEKVGNIPDPGKVPVLNLKTRELKIFDFGIEEEITSMEKIENVIIKQQDEEEEEVQA